MADLFACRRRVSWLTANLPDRVGIVFTVTAMRATGVVLTLLRPPAGAAAAELAQPYLLLLHTLAATLLLHRALARPAPWARFGLLALDGLAFTLIWIAAGGIDGPGYFSVGGILLAAAVLSQPGDYLAYAGGLLVLVVLVGVVAAGKAGRAALDLPLLEGVVGIGALVVLTLVVVLSFRRVAAHFAMVQRQRLAISLHDRVMQRLFSAQAVVLVLEERWRQAGDQDAVRQVEALAAQLAEAGRELRQAVASLAEIAHDDDADSPLESRLRSLLIQWERSTGRRAALSVAGDLSALGPTQRAFLLESVSELLGNVHKHARAQEVRLALRVDGRWATWTVQNDGRPLPGRRGSGMGLPILRRRARSLGGAIRSGPTAADGGWEVCIQVPI